MKKIIKHKKAEVEFKNNNTLWQITLDAMSEAVFLIDLDHKILQCNKATLDILGKSSFDKIIGHSCWELVHSNSGPIDWCPIDLMMQTRQRETTVQILNDKWVEISVEPVFNDEGEIIGAVHIINDVSARKKSEDILRESEQQYLTILNSLNDAMHVVDKDLKIIFQNPAMFQWLEKLNLGSENIGKTIFEAFPFLDYDKVYNEYDKVFKDSKFLISTEVTKLFDRHIFTETLKIPIISEGEVNQIITILRNITDQKEAEEKLKASEEKYKNIINNLMDVIIILDLKGNFEYVSPQVYEISGFKPEEIVGKSGFKLIHPSDIQKAAQALREGIVNRKRVYIEYRIIHKHGHYINVAASGRIVNIEGEDKIFAIVKDLTDQKIAEQKLKESEENFRAITEQSLMNILVLQDGLVKYFNDSVTQINGYSREEIENWGPNEFLKLIHPKDKDFVLDQARKKQAGEKDVIPQYRYRLIRKDKEIRWVENFSKTINYGGRPADLVTSIDITDKINAEQNLKESEENFRTIAEQAFMGTLIIQDDRVEYVNNALLQIFEYFREEVNNWSKDDLIKIIYPEDLQYLREYRKRLQANKYGIKPYYSYRVFTKYGKMKWIDQFSKPIIYRGKPAELITIMDITEKKKAEQELIKLNKLKSELLRRTSHELKTPLVSIKGFSDLLLTVHKDKLDDYVLGTIHEIKIGCERLENLIQDILKTSELESESAELKKKEEDLSFLIKLCVNELQGLIRLRNHEISLEIHDKLITWFEPDQIHLVISNLLNNAIKYTPPNGKIRVKSVITDDYILILIEDNGIGITYEERKRLFTQFGKIERYGQGLDIISEGSGLGLYITKKIVELHGGRITVKSGGRNKGSTFYFTLPLITEKNE